MIWFKHGNSSFSCEICEEGNVWRRRTVGQRVREVRGDTVEQQYWLSGCQPKKPVFPLQIRHFNSFHAWAWSKAKYRPFESLSVFTSYYTVTKCQNFQIKLKVGKPCNLPAYTYTGLMGNHYTKLTSVKVCCGTVVQWATQLVCTFTTINR